MHCSYCGSNLHTIANCPNSWGGSSRRLHMRCSYCGGRDHEIAACPKTWGGSSDRARGAKEVADHLILDPWRR